MRKHKIPKGIRVLTPLKRRELFINDLSQKYREVRPASSGPRSKVKSMLFIALQKVRHLVRKMYI
jgi:hypothetical protein